MYVTDSCKVGVQAAGRRRFKKRKKKKSTFICNEVEMRLFIFGITLYSLTYLVIYVGIFYSMAVDGAGMISS